MTGATKSLKTAEEIKVWILAEVRRMRGCRDFGHHFEITPANRPHDGTWEFRPSPPASNPCETTFTHAAIKAQQTFDLRL